VRRGASWTAASHVQLTVAAVARPFRRSVVPSQPMLLSCPGLLPAQTASARRSVQPASSGRPSSPGSALPGRQPRRRSPVGVHHALSTHPVSSSGILQSSRPVSSPSGVRSPGVVVQGLAVRTAGVHPSSVQPSGVQPSGVQPSGVQPSGPDASVSSHSGRWRWGAGRCGGAPVTTGTGRGPGGLPRRRAARSTANRPGGRAALPRSRGGQWGVAGGLAGLGAGGRVCPLSDQAGQAGVRSAGGWRREGMGAGWRREAAAPAAWLPSSGWVRDHGAWSSPSLTPGWAAPEGPLDVPAGWACGPSAAQVDGGRSRLAIDSAVTCGNEEWACQDLNLGPHPYQQNAGNRCAEGRFPRSRPTVEARVMCSHRVQLCVLIVHSIRPLRNASFRHPRASSCIRAHISASM
jgi:hypothetical protein